MPDRQVAGQIANLGKGVVQVNLRLSRITELLERGTGSGRAEGLDPELLFDLLEAIDATLAAARAPVPRRWWWGLFGGPPAPSVDLRGLTLAREHTMARLEQAGIEPIPVEGPIDPRLHRVVDVQPPTEAARDGTLAVTHRTGWVRRGDPPTVLRLAHVTAWRHMES